MTLERDKSQLAKALEQAAQLAQTQRELRREGKAANLTSVMGNAQQFLDSGVLDTPVTSTPKTEKPAA